MSKKSKFTKKQMASLRALYQQECAAESLSVEEANALATRAGAATAGGDAMLELFPEDGADGHEPDSNDGVNGGLIAAEDPAYGELGAPEGADNNEIKMATVPDAENESATDNFDVDEELLLDAWYAEYSDPVTRMIMRQPDVTEDLLEVVIGPDERQPITGGKTQAFPWRCICSLVFEANNGTKWIGTGWLIGPRTIITAGHCVYSHKNGGWARSVQVVPGRDGNQAPYGSCVATNFRSVTGWTKEGKSNFDYAAIILPETCRFGDQLGWFGFANYDAAILSRYTVMLSGYPGDKPFGTQWSHTRQMQTITDNRLVYDIDTYGGQSGAPVWISNSKGEHRSIGIHINGNATGNSAVRINKGVYERLQEWKQLGE